MEFQLNAACNEVPGSLLYGRPKGGGMYQRFCEGEGQEAATGEGKGEGVVLRGMGRA